MSTRNIFGRHKDGFGKCFLLDAYLSFISTKDGLNGLVVAQDLSLKREDK